MAQDQSCGKDLAHICSEVIRPESWVELVVTHSLVSHIKGTLGEMGSDLCTEDNSGFNVMNGARLDTWWRLLH